MVDQVRTLMQEQLDKGGALDVSTLLEALRMSSEGVARVAEQQSEHAKILREMSDTLHAIDKRLILLESGGVVAKLDDHEKRLTLLEADKNRRDGAMGLGTWFVKNWPGVLGFLVLIAVLADKGIIRP